MKTLKLGNVEIGKFVGSVLSTKKASERRLAINKILSTCKSPRYGCEEEIIRALKSEAVALSFLSRYPEIDLAFLNMGFMKEGIRYPRFSVHQIKDRAVLHCFIEISMPDEDETYINIQPRAGNLLTDYLAWAFVPKNGKVVDEAGLEIKLPKTLFKKYCQEFQLNDDEDEYELKKEFIGLIPTRTKTKIEKAEKACDKVFLVASTTEWKGRKLTKDPLVIGLLGEKAFLIDHFNTTPVEDYVKSEF